MQLPRYIQEIVEQDLAEKMVFLTGPRQVECKTADLRASPALLYFGERLNIPYLYQVHLEGQEDILDGRVRVMPAAKFLAGLP